MNERKWSDIKWGDILLVDFGEAVGSEQGGIRPALVIQNNKGNFYSPCTQVVPLTTEDKKPMPTHITLYPKDTGLKEKSTVLFEQYRTIDKQRILNKIGKIQKNFVCSILSALTINCGLSYNGNSLICTEIS